MEEKAQKYLNSQYVDYGDLNEKAEEQIKQAFINGMKEQLRIGGVSITLPPEENILNAMKLLAEIDYKNEWVWGYDTDLGKPEDVIKAFKNELLGN